MDPLTLLGLGGAGYLVLREPTVKPLPAAAAPQPSRVPSLAFKSGAAAGAGTALSRGFTPGAIIGNAGAIAIATLGGGLIGGFSASLLSENSPWTKEHGAEIGAAVVGTATAIGIATGAISFGSFAAAYASICIVGPYIFPIAVGVFAIVQLVGAVESALRAKEADDRKRKVDSLCGQRMYQDAFLYANESAKAGFNGLGFYRVTDWGAASTIDEGVNSVFGLTKDANGNVIPLSSDIALKNGTTVNGVKVLRWAMEPLLFAYSKSYNESAAWKALVDARNASLKKVTVTYVSVKTGQPTTTVVTEKDENPYYGPDQNDDGTLRKGSWLDMLDDIHVAVYDDNQFVRPHSVYGGSTLTNWDRPGYVEKTLGERLDIAIHSAEVVNGAFPWVSKEELVPRKLLGHRLFTAAERAEWIREAKEFNAITRDPVKAAQRARALEASAITTVQVAYHKPTTGAPRL